jgi:tetratricopeptide (TPR) repeat protein
MSDSPDATRASILKGQRVAFVGKLGGMTRRDARELVRHEGGLPVERVGPDVDLIVIGADELPLDEENLLDPELRQLAGEGKLEIVAETELWQRLGMITADAELRLYTPAMLAELLGVSISIIRRWHRRGLIVPVREAWRLPYFDFQEVATARQLAELLAAGASPDAIERKLESLSRYVPDVERPLAQLSVIVQGQDLLLRQGEGLIEPGGQLRIDFDALEQAAETDEGDTTSPQTLSLHSQSLTLNDVHSLVAEAARQEDEGQLEVAVELYRAALAAGGPDPAICFQLAELLYRTGDIPAARERYYMAVELNEDYVEARANLGCVLAETGQRELAVAAFQGALRYHGDYPDAHYHLARTLDELGRHQEAEHHWREFLLLAPNSPWSDEARHRLDEPVPDAS